MSGSAPRTVSVSRVDGRLKVTGAARYAADQPVDRVAHGYLLLSTVARGTVRAMDVAAAERAPGVLAVFTPFRPVELHGTGNPFSVGHRWLPLQDTEVRYYGQVIGLVVAETFEQARDAAALVRAEYDAHPPAASLPDGIPGATDPGPIMGEPARLEFLAPGVESIEAALAASEVTLSGRYTQPIKHHCAMEPHAATAEWQDDGLTLYTGTQSATLTVGAVAAALGVAPTQVRVVSPHVGGGFGNKIATWAHPLLAAAAARVLGRPVKVVLTREQTFTVTGHRSGLAQTVTLGARRDGTLVAVRHEAYATQSASGGTFEAAAHTTSRYLYRAENIHLDQRIVTLDIPPPTWMRAPGQESGSFALETALDELAVELGIDPVTLRLRNDATVYPGRNVPWSSKHLAECYEVGARRFGWDRRDPVPRSTIDGDWLVGTGVATANYPGERFPASVRIRFRADGTVGVDSATADLGTGMWTVLAVLGAESLGLPVDRIRPDLGDSTLAPNIGAFGSGATASTGPAVAAAARAAIAELVRVAVTHEDSPLYGVPAEEIDYDHGRLVAPGVRIGFPALLGAVGLDTVEATGSAGPGPDHGRYAFTSFGAHFCEVRVNRWTGEPRVSRITTVIDAGAIINATTARSQIVGGVIFGIGQALLEGSRLEPATGRIANANLADYLLPVNADVPPIDVHFLDHPDTLFNPLGARGIGEIGTVGVAAAIGNAVYHATGRRVRDLPITLDKLLD
ncbi:xanthine dehydrogenase family protein molybdopterin-binding subunit [Micromonospora sp. HM5-17]|jgi:xanthine dehydrogenase YagR molybdenum-binding subunit|uniref:xanthine dehydrogenase family protein molybdopterin-binding subunit n=1 Tax=Micromonospora sp. HM5-17 TaxID=2487710 RepID=UPI000F47F931|nr:xanthine dehydrogenase family protein molybdopterin-binding subunit [Micromonospora sp. HM5-17]ROT29810.1 xanthine dehydrogenase family protein molybdopterin-binding subunit [Micromonospora sp. HM5-17]